MKRIITLAGSNSQNSINKALIGYVSSLMEDVEIIPVDLNDYSLPMYSADFESDNGIPAEIKRLDNKIHTADAVSIASAEHNGSYRVVFKNSLDWLSRLNMEIWRKKLMLLMTTSPGRRGGETLLQSASAYFPFLGAQIIATYSLPSFYDNFNDGEVIEKSFKKELEEKVAAFSKEL